MKINVTKRDIERGVKRDAELCPVARAARRIQNGAAVDGEDLYYGPRSRRRVVALPTVAKEFVGRFDAGKKVEPFSFTVDDA